MSSPVATTLADNNVVPIGTPATVTTLGGLDHWLQDFQKYEVILAEMTNASADAKFKDELTTVELWFKALSEPERTASVYTSLQHSTQDQIRFFMAVLQKMIQPEERVTSNDGDSNKPKSFKVGLRPPSLNIPLPGSPSTPTPISASKPSSRLVLVADHKQLNLSRIPRQTPTSPFASLDGRVRTPAPDKSWASMVTTPLVPMFQKSDAGQSDASGSDAINNAGAFEGQGPGLTAVDPATLNKLTSLGLSNDAQLLALQLVMSGILQPTDIMTASTKQEQAPPHSAGKGYKKGSLGSWRTPTSAKYPGSALRSNVLKSSGLRSAGIKSSGLDSGSTTFTASPKVEDLDLELLDDIPAWLRSLRLHKYTSCFEGMTWQEMVVLDDPTLEKKGVAALGARRRLLRAFDHVRREMGMESATPTTSAVPASADSSSNLEPGNVSQIVPQSAAPTTRLRADSPVFMPTGKVPHSAAAAVVPTPAIASVV